jgi:hypothetical protein
MLQDRTTIQLSSYQFNIISAKLNKIKFPAKNIFNKKSHLLKFGRVCVGQFIKWYFCRYDFLRMKFTKVHIGQRVLWMFMALHILNFSIDTPHTLFDSNKVDADFEEVDSVVELVLEDVLQIDNAIPENHTKTPITQKMNAKKMVYIMGQEQGFKITQPAVVNYKVVQDEAFYINPLYNAPQVVVFSPPPEA